MLFDLYVHCDVICRYCRHWVLSSHPHRGVDNANMKTTFTNAYEAVSDAVYAKYVHTGDTYLVELAMWYGDAVDDMTITKATLSYCGLDPVWDIDWWEGEDNVVIIGVIPLKDIKIPEENLWGVTLVKEKEKDQRRRHGR